jgi:D-alanyl-D-alanine carboxypeptidase
VPCLERVVRPPVPDVPPLLAVGWDPEEVDAAGAGTGPATAGAVGPATAGAVGPATAGAVGPATAGAGAIPQVLQ